jgi:hypothetical protein
LSSFKIKKLSHRQDKDFIINEYKHEERSTKVLQLQSSRLYNHYTYAENPKRNTIIPLIFGKGYINTIWRSFTIWRCWKYLEKNREIHFQQLDKLLVVISISP